MVGIVAFVAVTCRSANDLFLAVELGFVAGARGRGARRWRSSLVAAHAARCRRRRSRSSSRSSSTNRSRSERAMSDGERVPVEPEPRARTAPRRCLRSCAWRGRSSGSRTCSSSPRRARPACSASRTRSSDTAIAFVCFCLAASGTYYLNDALDADADRRTRRSASGPSRPARSRSRTAIVGGSRADRRRDRAVVRGALAARRSSSAATSRSPSLYSVWLKHEAVLDLAVRRGRVRAAHDRRRRRRRRRRSRRGS